MTYYFLVTISNNTKYKGHASNENVTMEKPMVIASVRYSMCFGKHLQQIFEVASCIFMGNWSSANMLKTLYKIKIKEK